MTNHPKSPIKQDGEIQALGDEETEAGFDAWWDEYQRPWLPNGVGGYEHAKAAWMAASASTPPPTPARKAAEEIVGTVFDNTASSPETLKQTMIERIEQYLIERCFAAESESEQDE